MKRDLAFKAMASLPPSTINSVSWHFSEWALWSPQATIRPPRPWTKMCKIRKKNNFRRAHLVAHDMGDSILTEILSRHQRGMLPDYFNGFFRSVTFTNGGMVYDLINMRLSQVASQQEQNLYLIIFFSQFWTPGLVKPSVNWPAGIASLQINSGNCWKYLIEH